MSPRFDAYTATSQALRAADVVGWLFQHGYAGDTVHQGRGFHTFAERIWVQDDTGSQVGAVQWGGRQGDRVMVEVKGARTPAVVERLRSEAEHRCTRVDACVDFEFPGAWEQLLAQVLQVKAEHDLYGERRGDWEKPELGRTQYLGANSSAVRARLYEKGKEPDMRHLSRPDLVRCEVQVRPAKEAKETFSKLSPVEVWGASKWSRDLAGRVLEVAVGRNPAGAVWRQTTMERRLRFIAKQYGPTLLDLVEEVGSWECLGLTLRDYVAQARREKRRGQG